MLKRRVEKTLGVRESTDDVIVRATGVRKTYDTGQIQVNALKGVNLELRRGEMVAVMGPSGCGKTTLLNYLSDRAAAGRVRDARLVLPDRSRCATPPANPGWRIST